MRPQSAHAATWVIVAALGGWACPGDGGESADTGRVLAGLELEPLMLLPASAVPPAPMALPEAFRRKDPSRGQGDGPGRAARVRRRVEGTLSPDRSYSIGTPSHGFLLHGRPMPPDHAALVARPVSLERGAVYGTDELVGALGRVAEAVASRWPGSRLVAGDLSAAQGGDIPHHASHNSGRDADLVFFHRDAAGRMAQGFAMGVIELDGWTADHGKRFDVARNWAVVEALLRDAHIQVQWIFVAAHLRSWLLDHARTTGVDATLVGRAATVMRQPGLSPHHDHFHVRIYCAEDERMEGCVNGPRHPWIDTYEARWQAVVRQTLPLLQNPGRDEKIYAIDRLVRLRARSFRGRISPLVEDTDPRVAAMAAEAVAYLERGHTPPRWAAYLTEGDGEQ